jgi:hypothetical protein
MHQGSSAATIQPAGAAVVAAEATVAGRQTPVIDAILGFVDRHRRWFFAVAVLAYLVGFNGVWRPEPDSALYMTIGRNLAEGNGYTYLGKVDPLAYPGFPWFLAGVFKVFGAGSLFVPHLLVMLMAGATIVLTYAYFRLLTTRPMAVIVTLNLALAQTLYLCAMQLRNDVPFLMGVMAFLAGYEALVRRGRGDAATGSPVWGLRNRVTPWVLLLAGLAVAVAMRPTMLALVGAILMAAIWSVSRGSVRKRYVIATLVVSLAIVAAFYAMDPRRSKPGAAGGQYEQVAMSWIESPGRFVERLFLPKTIETFGRSTMEAMFGHELGLGINSAVTITVLGLGLWIVRHRPLWFFYLSATIIMMLVMAEMDQPFQTGETGQLVPRHFIGALPLLIYLWWRCAIWMEQHLPEKWGLVMVVVMTCVAFGPNVVKVCETIGRQRAYAYRTWHGESETNTVERLGQVLREHVEPGGTVVVPHKRGRQFAFYSGRRVLEATPILKYKGLPKPVYVLDESEGSVKSFVKRHKLAVGPTIASEPGRIDWRGRPQPAWTLHAIGRTPATTKPSAKP